MNLTWEEARARAENTKAIEESTNALSNVPSVFRIALRRAQATGEVISAASIVPLQVGGIVRRPILGLLGGRKLILGRHGAIGRGNFCWSTSTGRSSA